MKCTNCGKLIDNNNGLYPCPYCGSKSFMPNSKINVGNAIKFAIIFIVVVLVIMVILIKFKPENIDEVKESVVKIEVYDNKEELLATGSGFCAFTNNIVVTNFHVIEGASDIKIITNSGKKIEVENIIFSKEKDLVILKVYDNLEPLKLGNGSKIKIKDKVTAIGSPKGELNTVSEGIISNTDDQEQIRITAPISPGSSGGVLLDSKNRVIGITNAGYTDAQNLNFAINIKVLQNLYNDYSNGYVDLIDSTNYEECIPDIIDFNTVNSLSIKEQCDFSNKTLYKVNNIEDLYIATNKYNIFDAAMNQIEQENGIQKHYNNFSPEKKTKVADYYTTLIENYEKCSETNKESICELSPNISSWSMEQYIMELDILPTYSLAILMVYMDNYSLTAEEMTKFINEIEGITYNKKLILNKLLVPSDNRYNKEVINVINENSNFTIEQKKDLLKYLGFIVDSTNTVKW